jgi:hypothetical protein
MGAQGGVLIRGCAIAWHGEAFLEAFTWLILGTINGVGLINAKHDNIQFSLSCVPAIILRGFSIPHSAAKIF